MTQRIHPHLHLVERAHLAELVRLGNHLRDYGDVSRRAGHHDEFVVRGCPEREAGVLDPEFRKHLADFASLHVLQFKEQGLDFAGSVKVQRRAVVIVSKVVHGSQTFEELLARHVAEIARKHTGNGLGHDDGKPLRHGERVDRGAQFHVAGDERVRCRLPRHLRRSRGRRDDSKREKRGYHAKYSSHPPFIRPLP